MLDLYACGQGVNMPECKICFTLNPSNNSFCSYCGYSMGYKYGYSDKDRQIAYYSLENNYKEKDKLEKASNLSKLFSQSDRYSNSPLYKSNILFENISKQKLKIDQIKSISINVKDNTIRQKINLTIEQLSSLLEKLVFKKIDFEFVRFIMDFSYFENSIKVSRNLNVQELSSDLITEESKFNNWLEAIKRNYDDSSIIQYANSKRKVFDSLKEKIALMQLSIVLSTTSAFDNKTASEITETKFDIESLDSQIKAITYEIDRLDSELAMSNGKI